MSKRLSLKRMSSPFELFRGLSNLSLTGTGTGNSNSYRPTVDDDDTYGSDHHLMSPIDFEDEYSNPSVPIHRAQTSIGGKIQKIKLKSEKARRTKITEIHSFKDLLMWYMQDPIGHFPFIYFALAAISSIIFIVYWFMDNDSSYVLCGIMGLTMTIYAVYKFKTSISLRRAVDKYAQLNIKNKKEIAKLTFTINRAEKAITMLKKAKKRLHKANVKNGHNLKRFQRVEQNLTVMGKQANEKLNMVQKQTEEIRIKWRDEYLQNEREMLTAVFNRYERQHVISGRSALGMTQSDFKEFQAMLPERYARRFTRLGTFHVFAAGKDMIDINDFANTLDVFAEMETDGIDLLFTPISKTVHSHIPNLSSFDFKLSPIISSIMESGGMSPFPGFNNDASWSSKRDSKRDSFLSVRSYNDEDLKDDLIKHSLMKRKAQRVRCWICDKRIRGSEQFECPECRHIFCELHQTEESHKCVPQINEE